MAHYAFIDDNNIVTEVIVGKDEDDLVEGVTDWETHYGDFREQTCLRTSYNTLGGVHYTDGEPSDDQTKAFRFNYAGIGYTYDEGRDAFIPPKPFESWVLDEDTCLYVAPVALPDDADTVMYHWDEDAGEWVVVPDEAE